MLSLSSVTSTILSVVSGNGTSGSGQTNGAFLKLLTMGSNSFSTLGNKESLVDTLYTEDEKDTEPAAVPVELGVGNYPTEALLLSTGNREKVPASSSAPEPDAPQDTDAVVSPALPQERPLMKSTASPSPASQDEVMPKSDTGDIAEKIRNKIQELGDLLSALTALLGGGVGTVSLTVVRVETLSVTTAGGQNTLPANGAIDLSERFNQLIAAIEAGQKLPSDTKQSLTIQFGAFQSLLTPTAIPTGAVGVVDSRDLFLRSCTDCEQGIRSLQALFVSANATTASSTGDGKGELRSALGSLADWLKDFRSLIAQANVQTTTNQSPMQTLTASAVSTANNADFTSLVDAAPANTALPVSTATTAVSNIPSLSNEGGSNIVAAGLVAANSNFSGNANMNNGGQGGERPATSVGPTTALASASATTAGSASGFAKTLSATHAARLPLVEQVVFNVKTAIKDGSSKIEIKLDPAELGKLAITLETDKDGKTGVIVTVDQKSTLDLLQRDARGLERALADAGIKTDSGSLSFNLRGGDQGKGDQQQSVAHYAKLQPEEEIPPLAVITRSYAVQVTDGLDITI